MACQLARFCLIKLNGYTRCPATYACQKFLG